jgi:Divergent InlB B-repeat domain
VKTHFGRLALASLVLSTCVFALVAMHWGDFSENEENESPGDGDFAAIRLGYHGDPTDFRVEPRWFVESARQEKQMLRGVPGGAKTYARSSASPQALDPNAFTLLGPKPLTGEAFGSTAGAAGRVNAIVSDPDNTAVAFIGADGGGIWKTTNCCSTSTTWTVKTDFPELASMAIDDITMDPGNHNVLYAGTGDLNYGSFSFGAAGVLKSSDRGETWSLLGIDVFTMMYPPSASGYPQYQAVGKVVVDPNNSNNVIAGTKTGLYFSNDAGVNWAGPCYTNAFATGIGAQRQDMTGLLAVNVSGATRLYAAVGTRGNSTPVQPDLGNNGANGVYRASMPASGCPAVASWTLLSSGLPAGLGNGSPNTTYGRIEIAAAASDAQSLYALIADIGSSGIYGIYRTSNGGTSWTKLTNPDATQPDSGTKVGTQMWYDSGLTVSPTNPNTFFVSTVDLLISKDGGSTYTNLTSAYSGGPVHPDNHSRAVVGGDANKLINGNDGGAYYISNATTATSSSTATWAQMNSQLPTIEVYGGDITANFTAGSGSVAAGFQDNGSAYKVFSGTPVAGAWSANNSGDGFYSRIEPVLGTRFYSSVYYGQIYAGTRTTQSSIAGAWGSGSPTTTDRKSFLTAFDIYRYGSTSVAGSGCTAATGCTRLIYGTYRLWETITAGTPASSWKAKTGDLTKNNLIIGTDNRSYIQQLHYSFTDPTIAMAGTSDGNVQYVFNLGSGLANDATAVNVTGGNAVLPNRTIQDVNTDPVNPLIGYAAVAGFAANTPSTPGHVFRITCSANCASFTWVDKSGNLPDIPADAVIPNPNLPNQVFVGTDWGLYYTDDITAAAPVWQRFEGLPHVMVWSFTIDRGYTTLAAYTRGRGVWAWPLPTSGPTTHTVTPSVTGSGGIAPNTPQTVNHGATTAFMVTANANNHLVNVTGTCGGTLAGNTFTTNAITADCTVIANFAIDTHTVTPSVTGNGSIAPNTPQTVNHGATTVFMVTADANNHLVNVTGNCGGTLVGNAYTTNAITANCTVIANFAIDTHVVTPSVTGNGAIAPNTPQTVNQGATTAFMLTANANNHLVNVTGTCGGNLVGNTYTTNAVTADCSVIANFDVNVLVFTTQPADIGRGNLLNTVVVTEQDGSGNAISDNATVTFTINVCGSPLTLGSVAMVNGVATLNATAHFYALASGLTIAASTTRLNGTSAAFNVITNTNYVFADGFDGCRL